MTKKDFVVFLGGANAYAERRLLEEASLLKLSMGTVIYRNVNFQISSDTIKIFDRDEPIPEARGVFLRGLGEEGVYNPIKYYLVDWYEKLGSKVINSRSFKGWPSLDKTTQYLKLSQAHIPVIDSFAFGSISEAIERVKELGYPIIVKDIVGGLGAEVYKIKNEEDLGKLLNGEYNLKSVKRLLFQRFLEGGRDLRVIVIGGKVIGAMERVAPPGKYLANYSQGGIVLPYDIGRDSEASQLATKVSETFLLDYCGVDLMKDEKGNWAVLEVNRACQFEGFEKATGINVARKILQHFF